MAAPRPTLIEEDVNEVTLDIIARDKHRQPVRDLTAGDFRITDDGKPVVLKSFHLASTDRNPKELRTLTVLIEANQPESGRAAYEATSALIKDLAELKTYYSAWQIADHLNEISEFTSDSAKFQEALRSATVRTAGRAKNGRKRALAPETAARTSGNAGGSEALPAALQGISAGTPTLAENIAAQRHVKPWLACLSALVSQQAQVTGRKLIVFFSPGEPNQEGITEALLSLISDANRSGTSIYVVDLSGLSSKASAEAVAALPVMGFGAASLASQTAAGYKAPVPTGPDRVINAPLRDGEFDSVDAHPDFQRNGPLRKLANDTGGIYIAESNKVRDAMSQIAEDAQTYYEAVYVPAGEPADGHFRPVSLHLDRPHVVARTRSGYYWTPTAGGWKVAPFEIPLIKALDSAALENAIPVEAQVLRFGDHGSNRTVALAVQFPFDALQSRDDDNEKLAKFHFAVLGLVRTRDGKIVQKVSEDVPYEAALEEKENLESQVFTFQQHFELPAGDYWAELAVRDENAATIGTQAVPFSLDPPKPKLRISDIALLRNVTPARREPGNGDPLRYGDQEVTIQAASRIREAPERKLPIFVTIYPDPAVADSAKVEIEIRRGTDLVSKFNASIDAKELHNPQSFLASLPEASLPSGRYVVIVRAMQDGIIAERQREFEYEGASIEADRAEVSHLLLTPAPKLMSGVQPPDEKEISAILSGARRRAVDFQTGLPNFLCFLRTERFYDRTGQEDWKQHDTITELVRYASGHEQYSTLEVNGEHVTTEHSKLGGVQANGVFGQLLGAVFSESAGASFKWQGKAEIDGSPVHVFAYSVPQSRSIYDLRSEDATKAATVGFHGLVYIDPNTLLVRHVSVQADGIPKDFAWKESIISVDYDYVNVGDREYLLPLSATLRLRRGNKMLYKNEMQFRDYHRFAASSRVLP